MNICRVFLMPILLLIIFCGCSVRPHPEDRMFGRDKLYHFMAAGAFGAGAAAVASNNGVGDNAAPTAGIAVGVTVGAGKEVYDVTVKQTYWSWKDLFWDVAGAVAGSYAAMAVL